jgi:hypothetical protein
MTPLTPHGSKLLGAIQRNFVLLDEHAKAHPAEVEAIVAAMVAHIRSWKPMIIRDLDTSPFAKAAP